MTKHKLLFALATIVLQLLGTTSGIRGQSQCLKTTTHAQKKEMRGYAKKQRIDAAFIDTDR